MEGVLVEHIQLKAAVRQCRVAPGTLHLHSAIQAEAVVETTQAAATLRAPRLYRHCWAQDATICTTTLPDRQSIVTDP